MTPEDIRVEYFGDRAIAIKGIGKLFYEEGFPISMTVSELKKHGIEVSLFHVADECLKNGWEPKTVVNKLKADLEEDISSQKMDATELEAFCYASYEDQREMIFNYLFSSRNEAKGWLLERI